ncbi:MAG: alpha/beta hydrolase [Dehalococcoidia bacterium]
MNGYRDRFATIDGSVFHYLDWGNPTAPPVILLHGGSLNAHAWDAIAEQLADRFRLIAPDARNHGDTDSFDGAYDYSDLAGDVGRLADAVGIVRHGLIGHSMGGRIAQVYATRFPERLDWLVIEDTPVDDAQTTRGRPPQPETFGSMDEIVAIARRGLPHAGDEVAWQRALFLRRPLAGGRYSLKHRPGALPVNPATLDLWAGLAGLRCPTLVLRGADSTIFPAEAAERQAAAIPGATLVTIPNGVHDLKEDNPAAFWAALDEFLGRLG